MRVLCKFRSRRHAVWQTTTASRKSPNFIGAVFVHPKPLLFSARIVHSYPVTFLSSLWYFLSLRNFQKITIIPFIIFTEQNFVLDHFYLSTVVWSSINCDFEFCINYYRLTPTFEYFLKSKAILAFGFFKIPRRAYVFLAKQSIKITSCSCQSVFNSTRNITKCMNWDVSLWQYV